LLQLYSIYDKKAGSYSAPFTSKHIAEAIRGITMLLTEGKTTFAQFPADYTLIQVGSFDEASGKLENTIGAVPLELAALAPQKGQ